MSSPSNDIHTDIRDLLRTETLTPEMERVVSVMRVYRPRVDIDASYRNKLKQSLLIPSTKKITHTRPSWFAWMGWIGTSCAALIVTLWVIRIFFPEKPQYREHIPATVESPTPEIMTSMDAPVPDTRISDIKTESTISDPQITQDDVPMARMAEITPEPTTTDIVPSTSDALAPMLADASVGWAYTMMAIPEGNTLAKTATPTSIETPTSDSDISVESEMQDMIWEINTIISETKSARTIIIPDYSFEMPIYTKDGIFTREEESLLAGSGIVSTIVPTYAPDILKSIVIERRGTMTLTGTPTVRYISYKRWSQSILVPTVIYTTTTWVTLEVSLVPGY